MAHVRSQIRRQVVALLQAAAPDGITRIYDSLVRDQQLPSITVFADADEQDGDNFRPIQAGEQQTRRLIVRIEVRAQETQARGAASAIDDAAVAIGAALVGDPTLEALSNDYWWEGFESEFSDEGDQAIGLGVISVAFRYRVDWSAADVAIP